VDLAAVRESVRAQANPAAAAEAARAEAEVEEYNRGIRLIAAELALGMTDADQVREVLTQRGMPEEAIQMTLDNIEVLLDTMAKNLSGGMEAPARELLNRAGAGMSASLLEHADMQGVELTFTLRRTPGGHEFTAYAHMSRDFAPSLPAWTYDQLTTVTAGDVGQLGDLLATTMESAWTKLQGG
jgi:hypothetical protein